MSSNGRCLRRCARQASALGWLFAACGCASLGVGGGFEAAQIRFVEISPGTPLMDIYVNGTGAAYGVGYESFTSYLPVGPGPVSMGFHRAGMGQSLLTASGTVIGNHQYTAVVSHGPGGLQERLFEDQEVPAPAGRMALRVLNEAAGAGAITVYLTPDAAVTAAPDAVFTIPAGAASLYLERPAEVGYTVTATVADGNLSLPVASVYLKAGSGAVRTVVFGGTTLGTGHGSVVGFSLVDADAP